MDPAYSRHSRRSHPNLQHLSLLPLTPHYPLPPTAPSLSDAPPIPSYITPKSMPTTPSLLSRSSSRTRLPTSRSNHALLDLDLNLHLTQLPASKSTTSLSTSHTRHRPRSRRSTSHTTTTTTDSTDWLFQTATLLTSTARAEKGQAWLATRSSSTSLTALTLTTDPYNHNSRYGLSTLSLDTTTPPHPLTPGGEADDEYSPTSYRTPFSASRAPSRFASARGSRRGSRVGGAVGEEETVGVDGRRGLEGMAVMEPDFVDGDGDEGEGYGEDEEEEEVDEGEVRRLIGGRVGGWVDWLVGWMDFRDDGEGEEGGQGDVGEREEDAEEGGKERDEGLRRRKRRESERVALRQRGREREGEMQMEMETGGRAVEKPPEEGEGGWKDAAWLLNVATKIIT